MGIFDFIYIEIFDTNANRFAMTARNNWKILFLNVLCINGRFFFYFHNNSDGSVNGALCVFSSAFFFSLSRYSIIVEIEF